MTQVTQADIVAALSHLGFDSVSDLHYWAKCNNELNRFDALTQLLASHRLAACEPTVAKLLMNPPAPMTDPDEEAAKRVMGAWFQCDPAGTFDYSGITRATEQMRREREAWEAGR